MSRTNILRKNYLNVTGLDHQDAKGFSPRPSDNLADAVRSLKL
jgi:hypothetical protein